MSMAQDFLDKLQAGTIETKSVDESVDVWARLQAVMEDGARRLAEEEQQMEVKPQQPPPTEPSGDAPTPEQIADYKTKIDKIFAKKHFGKLVAPTIRNSIRKALKEQLPSLDYKDANFIKKFEEANEEVTKIATRIAGEFEGILREYKATVQELAGVEVESILTEE